MADGSETSGECGKLHCPLKNQKDTTMESCTWRQKLQVQSRYIALVNGFYLNLQSKKNRLLKVSCLPGLLPWESGAVCSVLTAVHSHSLIPSRKCVFSFSHWCESVYHRWGDIGENPQTLTFEGVKHMTSPCSDQQQLLCVQVLCDPFLKNNFIDIWSVSSRVNDGARQAHWEPFFKWLDLFISSRNWEEPAEKYLAVCN